MGNLPVVRLDHGFPQPPKKAPPPTVKLSGRKWEKRRADEEELRRPPSPEVYEEIRQKRLPHDVSILKAEISKARRLLDAKDFQAKELRKQLDSAYLKEARTLQIPEHLVAQLCRLQILADQKDVELQNLRRQLEKARES